MMSHDLLVQVAYSDSKLQITIAISSFYIFDFGQSQTVLKVCSEKTR